MTGLGALVADDARRSQYESIDDFARQTRNAPLHACFVGSAVCLKPDLTPPKRAVGQVEGWILGVA